MFYAVGSMRGSLFVLLIFFVFSVNADSKLDSEGIERQSDDNLDERYESLFAEDHEIVAVRIDKNHLHEVDEIAKRHGYENLGQIGSLDGYYEFKHVHNHGRLKRAALNRLYRDARVEWSEPQRPLKRIKRQTLQTLEVPTLPWPDPLYEKQWYLHAGAQGGYDMKIREAWKLGYSGKGVVTSILDDGIEPTHPDLAINYDPKASKDINDRDDDPTPQDNGDNKHGTRCAGEVAAIAGNNQCGVGVAYHSKIGGVRMLDGTVTDSVEAASLSLNPQHIDIYSASWGPEDDGKTFDGPGPLAKEAFYKGITEGRGGKGNIFIWASGNGGSHADSCSCDGYTTSIYTLSVSSATYNNRRPWYLEECPSTLTTTYSSAGMGEPAIVTVDMPHSCTLQHTGTSASAPMAAGIVALALEANPQLTWRDMQHLVVLSSDPTPLLQEDGWHSNAVGRQVSNKFGYGLMNAEVLVRLARDWKTVPPQHICSLDYKFETPNNPYPLKGKFRVNFSLPVTGCEKTSAINYLEHVQVVLTVQYSRRGDLKITIISPSGTESVLLPPRPQDVNHSGFHKWPFLTVQQWGEDPRGIWTLIVENVGSEANFGTLHEWSLTLYGTETLPQPAEDWKRISGGTLSPGVWKMEQSANEPNGSGNNLEQMIYHTGCHPECDENAGCHEQNAASACLACRHFRQLKRNRAGFTCVDQCRTGYYTDKPAGMCRQCKQNCASCLSAEECDSCQKGMYLVQVNDDPKHLHHGKCMEKCPNEFYATEEPTKSKNGYGLCLHLQTSSPSSIVTTCTVKTCANPSVCPVQHYCSTEGCCEPCDSSCSTCAGPGPTQCSACPSGTTLQDGACLQLDCGPGQYKANDRSCHNCDSACSTCFDFGPNKCSTCAFGFRKVSGHCLNESDFVKTENGTATFSNLTLIAILSCVGAVVVFVLVFLCLMWKDRRRRDVVDSSDRSQYEYSKVPIRYQLNGKDSVIAPNGKVPLSLDEEEHFLSDEDEEEMLYDSDMMIKR